MMLATRKTIEELAHDLGDIPLSRIRLSPALGTATIVDVERIKGCELVEGTLVEKTVGYPSSMLTVRITSVLLDFILARNLGVLAGRGGRMELHPGLARAPDVSYVAWDRMPYSRIPSDPVPSFAPNLAVELLNEGNTKREMERKRREYFTAGTRLVWIVDPVARTVAVYTSETNVRVLTESDTLDGGDVLPGFRVELRTIFAELDRKRSV